MKARKSRKITQSEFEKLYYVENLTNRQICEHFGVKESALGSFRKRHGYKPRTRVSRVRVYPERWTCEQCGDSFPNKTGHPRKFCSHRCYSLSMKGTNPNGGFLNGDKHWNYTGKAIMRTYNHLVFNYSDKKAIAEACNYTCRMCKSEFDAIPIYRLQKYVSFDHIVPIAMDGEHSISNGQMLCRPCTKVKNSLDYRKIVKKNHKLSSNPSFS